MRCLLAAAAAVVAVVMAGCTSSPSPAASSSIPAPSLSATQTPTTDALSSVPEALDSLTSVHLEIDAIDLGGKSSADVQLQGGKTVALLVHTTEEEQDVDVLTVDGKSFVKLPERGADGKPWALVSSTSGNRLVTEVAELFSSANVTRLLASVDAVRALVGAAGEPTEIGTERVGSTPATHYRVAVDPKRVDASSDFGQLIGLIATNTVPVDIWIDDRNRPVKVSFDVKAMGIDGAVSVVLSDFDAPLDLQAPNPAEVSTA